MEVVIKSYKLAARLKMYPRPVLRISRKNEAWTIDLETLEWSSISFVLSDNLDEQEWRKLDLILQNGLTLEKPKAGR